jgi:DNA gyrase subunit A
MKLRAGDEVIAVEIARDDQDLLVVTENGFGKRTRVEEYPAKGRGTMGVLTIRYTEARGRLAGAMIVKDGYDLMLISHDGTVIRTAAEGISRMGRATQGVRLMNLREGDHVSAIARVTEPQGAPAADAENGDEPADQPDGTVETPDGAAPNGDAAGEENGDPPPGEA